MLAIVSSMIGTTLAKQVLEAMSDQQYRRWANGIITAIADTSIGLALRSQLRPGLTHRTAQLNVEVSSDMESALAQVRQIATRGGGYVSASNTHVERVNDQDRMVAGGQAARQAVSERAVCVDLKLDQLASVQVDRDRDRARDRRPRRMARASGR